MSGSVSRATWRPLLVAGVEKRLMVLNALLSFPLVAATHFHFPMCFIGVGFFVILHVGLRWVSKFDPELGMLFKRSTRYVWRSYFPAKSHVRIHSLERIKTISRPRV